MTFGGNNFNYFPFSSESADQIYVLAHHFVSIFIYCIWSDQIWKCDVDPSLVQWALASGKWERAKLVHSAGRPVWPTYVFSLAGWSTATAVCYEKFSFVVYGDCELRSVESV